MIYSMCVGISDLQSAMSVFTRDLTHILTSRQQWLVSIPQRQTAMASGRPGQEVSSEGHCHSRDLQLIWLGHQVHFAVWRPTRRLDSIHNEGRKPSRYHCSRKVVLVWRASWQEGLYENELYSLDLFFFCCQWQRSKDNTAFILSHL